MLKNIFIKVNIVLLALLVFACGQNESEFGTLVRDNKPAIPVLITGNGVFTFGGNPTLPVSVATGNIEATISIPASTGRTIKEIKSIIAGNSVTPGTLTSPSSVKLNTASIPVNGTEYKFSTTLTAVRQRYPTLNITPVALPAPPSPPTYRNVTFLFLVVLDSGDEIVSVPFDVRLLP
jgi:hypothetical protein